MTYQREVKVLELRLKRDLALAVIRRKTRVMEYHAVAQNFVYQKRLSYTTATIHNNKFRLFGVTVF